jgi:hypothetical protein
VRDLTDETEGNASAGMADVVLRTAVDGWIRPGRT